MKFKTKIILIFSVISIVLVAVTARVAFVFVKTIYMEQLREQLYLLSALAAKELDLRFLEYIDPAADDNMARLFYQERLRQLAQDMQFNDMFLFDSSGTVLTADSANIAAAGVQINQPLIKSLPEGQSVTSVPFQTEDGNWYLWVYRHLNGPYYLGMREQARRLTRLNTLAGWFLAIALAAMILVVAAGWWLARTIAAPVNRLVDYSAQIGRGNFDVQAPQNIQGELAILRDALVTMQTDLAVKQKEKEQMLAQIAHELRNPLGGIELLAGLVKERLPKGEPNYGYMHKIVTEIQGLKEQISAFLNFSRPPEAHPREVNLAAVISQVKASFEGELRRKSIRWQEEISIRRVRFDPRHLRQILHNIAANSLQAVPGGGTVIIRSYEHNGAVHIEVSDDGPGIPPQHTKRIFEPFFTTRQEGTGMGLAICQKLCIENHAQIYVTNHQTKGCTFCVQIPL